MLRQPSPGQAAKAEMAGPEARVRQVNDKRIRFILDHMPIDEASGYDLVDNTYGHEQAAHIAEFLGAAWKAHTASRDQAVWETFPTV